MAIVNFLGFESGNAIECSNSGGTVDFTNTAVKRTGTYALRVNPTTTGTGFATIANLAATGLTAAHSIDNFFATFYFRYATKPAANSEEICYTQNGGTSLLFCWRLTSGGLLALYDTNGTTLVTTGSTVLAVDTWYRLTININNTANTQTLKINDTTEISASQSVTSNTSLFLLGKTFNRNSQSIDFFYDDVCIDNAADPGAGECRIAVPIGATLADDWTNGTGLTFAEVDEIPFNTSDYIQASATEDTFSHTFDMQSSATIGIAGAIGAVKAMVVALTGSTSGSSLVNLYASVNSGSFEASPLELLTTYQLLAKVQLIDAGGSGAITSADFDTIEVGMEAGAITQTQRFTVAYLTVWCEGSTTITEEIDSVLAKLTASLNTEQTTTFTTEVDATLRKLTASVLAVMVPAAEIDAAIRKVSAALAVSQRQEVELDPVLAKVRASLNLQQEYRVELDPRLAKVTANLNVSTLDLRIVSSLRKVSGSLNMEQSQRILEMDPRLVKLTANLNLQQIGATELHITSTLAKLSASLSVSQPFGVTITSTLRKLSASLNLSQRDLLTIVTVLAHLTANINVSMLNARIVSTLVKVAAALAVSQRYQLNIDADLRKLTAALAVSTLNLNIDSDLAKVRAALNTEQLVTTVELHLAVTLAKARASLNLSQWEQFTIDSDLRKLTAAVAVNQAAAAGGGGMLEGGRLIHPVLVEGKLSR